MKENYIKMYSQEIINLAEYLCDWHGGNLNYNDKSMVDYWITRAIVLKDLY